MAKPISPTTPANTIEMLTRVALPELIGAELERMIAAGEVMPGDKLNEATLAERLGVSRGPVREAFRTLEELGLIRQEKNRGVFVRELTPTEAAEIFEIRAGLERLAAGRLAKSPNKAALERLAEVLTSMETALSLDDGEAYHGLNLRFHQVLVESAGNRSLAELYGRLVKQIGLFRLQNYPRPEARARSLEDHLRIFEAIAEARCEDAMHITEQHVLASRNRMLDRTRNHQESKP